LIAPVVDTLPLTFIPEEDPEEEDAEEEEEESEEPEEDAGCNTLVLQTGHLLWRWNHSANAGGTNMCPQLRICNIFCPGSKGSHVIGQSVSFIDGS